jgi:hypothetical protein
LKPIGKETRPSRKEKKGTEKEKKKSKRVKSTREIFPHKSKYLDMLIRKTSVMALYMYPLYKAKIFCLPAKKLLALKAGKRERNFPFKSL